MENWTAKQWFEWRRERRAILEVEEGLSFAEADQRAGVLEALERLRVKSEAAAAREMERRKAAAPKPEQAVLPGMETAFGDGSSG
jgi:hypothetical protein